MMLKDILAILLYHAGIAAIEIAERVSPQIGESQPGLSTNEPEPQSEQAEAFRYLGVTENETARQMREEAMPKPSPPLSQPTPKPLKGSLESRGKRLQ